MTEPDEILEIDNPNPGVRRLVFHRPHKKNAFTYALYAACTDALDAAADDPNIRCVILTGAGGVFTAGNDLGEFAATPPTGADNPIFAFLHGLVDFPKPLVAAVEGHAVGIGTTMLLHCDFVYAGPTAKFALPFVNLGLVPEGGSTQILPNIAGRLAANELLMLGEPFGPEQAETAGIVTRVSDDPAADALRCATALTERPLTSLIETKRLIRDRDRALTKEVIAEEGRVFAQRLVSNDAREAFTAFFEKRKPNFGP